MTPESFLRELLDRMTLEEKLGQLNLLTGAMDATGMKHSGDLAAKVRDGRCGAVLNVFTPAATRTLQQVALESPHKIPLLFGYDVIHGHRTLFPIPLGLSCSWNPDLLEKCARAAAAEAAADGLHWVFSPMVDITQDARWGRVAEGSGEDPWLGSRLAAAMVRGYQGENLAAPASVLACVKHLALYGASLAGRDYHAVDMSRREMEETYFPPYRAAVDAGALTVMTSFNLIDGIPASGNRWLLTDILRHAWGFTGWVVTDYTAVSEMKNHGTAATEADCASQSLRAGVDMDMVSEAFLQEIPALVKSGALSESLVDAAVLRILRTKWDLGLFQDPFARCDDARATATHLCPDHRQLARLAARESIVLLRNDASLLPLPRRGTLALIGPLADSPRDLLGCWTAAGDPADAITPLDGFREAMGDAGEILHAPGCGIHNEDPALMDEALRTATLADTIILILGESHDMSGEAASRTDIRLPKAQRRLAKRLLRAGKPVILITLSGRPLQLDWESRHIPTLLHAWAPGTEGGHAIADIVFGADAPVGKLTMGFPRSVGQLPMTYREKPTGRPFDPAVPYSSRYLDCPNSPLFPFGHGLTYGSFQFGNMAATPTAMTPGGSVEISVEITNPHPHPVTDTLQLYLRDPVAAVSRPVKELRGFQRHTLAPADTRRVTFLITDADLAYPGPDFLPLVEPGIFIALLGTSSENLQSITFTRLTAAPA